MEGTMLDYSWFKEILRMAAGRGPVKAILIDLMEDTAIPGAVEALKRLRSSNVPIKFVTNTTKESRRCLYERLMSLGFELKEEEIWSSLWAAQDCSGNGVCNSRGHCHCNKGYAPPFCDYPGTGGSEDSGPASDPNDNLKFQVTSLCQHMYR